jgi:outer membrane biosynthesis protein TonB
MSSNSIIKFTNSDGSALTDGKIKFQAKAGFESVREIMVTNVHIWPIQIVRPNIEDEKFSVLSYPTEALAPGQSGKVEIQYKAPADEVNLRSGTALFDVDISKFG